MSDEPDRFDEIFRRGKGLLDFMDEVVKETIAKQSGIPVEGLSDLYSEIKEHVRLKDAVVEAAKEWYIMQNKWGMPITDGDFNDAVYALLEFERGIKESR